MDIINYINNPLNGGDNLNRNWYTPNTYDTNYKNVPGKSGVYMLVKYPTLLNESPKILYVGSTKNLSERYKNHEVLRFLKFHYGYVRFYFNEVLDFIEVEKFLIKKIRPPYNTQHNG